MGGACGQNIKTIKLNGYDFLDMPEGTSNDVWQMERYSWKDVYQLYKEIRTNLTDVRWIGLNSEARSLILEDEDRITYGAHPGVRRGDKPTIESVFTLIKACYENTNCVNLDLTAPQKSWLSEGLYHQFILSRMNSNDPIEKKRMRIKWLFKEVSRGADG